MKKWEYMADEQEIYKDCVAGWLRKLNDKGLEGWELTTIIFLHTIMIYIYKRPLEEK